jgi:hypothetical protein
LLLCAPIAVIEFHRARLVMRADGSGARLLADTPREDLQLSWAD